ncbi:restriction endonuclease [Paenibacillus thiaminolyticus]|uniref:Restriction endonuclease n=1 Tax=Paenibacillus thiaminolyticus TaxID=49283 RepID=A0A3A3GJM6_PANTH|nr:restriction endonuclease [Paenibacillus thiaminolyticus]RJG22411.1 restriction endonuclease [Paenibacillus thiaminolyticus]
MLKKKSITGLVAFFSLLLVFSTSVSANAKIHSASPKSTVACEDIRGEVSYQKDESGKIVKKITKVSDVEEYSKKFGITLPSPDAEILHISPVTEIADKSTPTNQPLWIGDLYIKNLEGPREACDSELLKHSYYDYPGGTMSVSQSVQASYGGAVSVSAEIINASVSFNVTHSYAVSDSQNVEVPFGKRASVKAFPVVYVWQYDIYKKGIFSDSYEGYGWAQKPTGVCFSVVIY